MPGILGFIYGFQYQNRRTGECFEVVLLNLNVFDEMLTYIAQIYLPGNWPTLGLCYKDLMDINASIQTKCNLDILLTRTAEIWSIEGASAFLGRIAMGLATQGYFFYLYYVSAPSDFYRMEVIGQIISLAADFKV